MARLGRHAKLLQKPDEHIVRDHDPEVDGANDPQNFLHSDSDDSDEANAGTEHYVEVGKSRMRRKEAAALGPQYRGSRVSRDALDESADDEEDEDLESDGDSDSDEVSAGDGHYADPDLVNLEEDTLAASDSEIDSDDALTASDAERLKDFVFRGSAKPLVAKGSRPSAADYMSSDEDGEGGAYLSNEDEDESDEDMADGLDELVDGQASVVSNSEDEVESSENLENNDGSNDAAESGRSREGVQLDSRPVINGTGAKPQGSTSTEVQKGAAIQQQRKTYDGLLNLRIRLQKALVAANSFPTLEEEATEVAEPYAAAEEAAVNLLNTMSAMRDSFAPSVRPGMKRKRGVDTSTSNADIWAEIDGIEKQLSKQRQALLEKWSRKTQGGPTRTSEAKLLSKGAKKPLTSALRDQLNDPEGRLIKRTKVPRSCAPAQAAQRVNEDEAIYDDADFYQLLLKELVDQRTVESASAAQGSTVMLAAAKDAKTRRDVDRKASKGRKMRFTVHEKLQNFMAPEDRRSWEPAAIDRLFGTLFGQKLGLNEEEVESDEEDMDVDVSGLRLFG